MSLRSLLSTTMNKFENKIKTSSESFEKFTADLAEKAKELNSPYNIKCEELEHLIKYFEELNEILERYRNLFPNFSIDEYISSEKHLENSKNDDLLNINQTYFECIKSQQDMEVEARKLTNELFGKDIAKLEMRQIKEHLYKNWKFKK